MNKPRIRKDLWNRDGWICYSTHGRGMVFAHTYGTVGTGDTILQAYEHWKVRKTLLELTYKTIPEVRSQLGLAP